ncbi:MAG: shikimate kinase [Oceanospirillales bacterium]|uniref:shikimate kinase n=1 Tax=Marinobacter maritimus TaxID=277961 RepID=UPI000BDC5BA0|nr:shikimate kinase [Marinobacter maritimus]MBL1273631.1 shikimate kinase [Oceanospirillales bacterium]
MLSDSRNLIFVGMPGSGKSTVGVLVAKRLGLGFIDTDLLIQQKAGCTLQDIVNQRGYLALRLVEEEVLLQLNVEKHVLSTGGSAVYSDAAMTHLKMGGIVIFLDISLDTVASRIGDYSLRGISKRPEQSLIELYEERSALYSRYADITIQGDALSQERVCEVLIERLSAYHAH